MNKIYQTTNTTSRIRLTGSLASGWISLITFQAITASSPTCMHCLLFSKTAQIPTDRRKGAAKHDRLFTAVHTETT